VSPHTLLPRFLQHRFVGAGAVTGRLAAAAFVVMLAAGCGDDDGTKPDPVEGPEYVTPSTPQNVLRNFVTAHEALDIEGYSDALADDFQFRASPFDAGVEFTTLTREEDITSTTNMFNSVVRITMDLTYDESSPAAPSDVSEYPAEDGYVMIVVQQVNLDVVTMSVVEGEPVVLRVAGEPAKVIFKLLSASPERYAISAIHDQAGSGGRVGNQRVQLTSPLPAS